MELAISAVTGELVSRFVSFLSNRYQSSRTYSEEKQLKRLQQLLLRARTVVEEADARYITNFGMLAQLKMLADAMYRGYCVLEKSKYRSVEETPMEVEVISNSSPLKRSRTVHVVSARENKARYLLELQGALESIENVVNNMTEFVLLLGGCQRVLRRPYDAYLYSDNIMFGRHAEKQELLNFMLYHSYSGTPAVLPIIGAPSVGKRTLVAHVCKDDRVSSHFSSILHLNEDSFLRISDHGSRLSGKVLVVVELVSDVDRKDWAKFYSYVASMDGGSKVIIISRHRKSEELGTVKPIFIDVLSYEEFRYLFKTLAFGSANPAEHPRLVRIADEFARELQLEWSLVAANFLADAMRRNLNARFWLCMLSRARRVVQRNLSIFGEHPRFLVQRRHQIDVTDFVLHPVNSPLRTIRCISSGIRGEVPFRTGLPKVTLGDLLVDPSVRPEGEFNILIWESRVPPYTSYVHFVPSCAPDMPQDTPLPGRKRRWVPF